MPAPNEDNKTPQELMREAVEQLSEEEVPAEEVVADEAAPEADKEQDVEHDEAPVESDVEKQARALGWRPKEEFEGDTSKYVGPDEFLRRQELFDHIKSQKKQIARLEKQQKEIAKYVKSLTESEYTKQLAALKAQRQLALEDGDVDRADKLNDSIADMQVARKQEESEQEADAEEYDAESKAKNEEALEQAKQDNQRVINAWMGANPWYNSDPELHDLADDFAELFAKKHPEKTLNELLEFVDKKIAKLVPKQEQGDETEEVEEKVVKKPLSKVTVANRRSADGVRRGAAPKFSRADLNPTQLSVLNNWILPQKVMTEQEYIESLVKSGELSK